MTAERIWSPYQRAIFENVANATGHTVVVARAGTGKSTTILESLRHVPPHASVLLCAFNKVIAEELKQRAPSNVETKTLHALGYQALRGAWGRHVTLDSKRDAQIVAAIVPESFRPTDRRAIVNALALAKANLATSDDDLRPYARIAADNIDWDWYLDDKFKPLYTERHLVAWMSASLALARKASASISFDDMVYAPASNRMRTGLFDYVFIDETQDMSKAQLSLARMALRPGGRVIAVGDDRQAIYSWRGADSRAIPRMTEELGAATLKLPVSYRCPRSVADLAREVVPDFETPPGAPIGSVDRCGLTEMVKRWSPGDFVLSRTNAPLVSLCLRALAEGHRAHIQGRNVAEGLAKLIERSHAQTIEQLLAWITEWTRTECVRLEAAGREDEIDDARDRGATLAAIAHGMATVQELRARVDSLFSDERSSRIRFSSVHRAKGLESERVWLLEPTFKRRGHPRHSAEEDNLWYVAVTRSKHELWLVAHPETRAPEAPR